MAKMNCDFEVSEIRKEYELGKEKQYGELTTGDIFQTKWGGIMIRTNILDGDSDSLAPLAISLTSGTKCEMPLDETVIVLKAKIVVEM